MWPKIKRLFSLEFKELRAANKMIATQRVVIDDITHKNLKLTSTILDLQEKENVKSLNNIRTKRSQLRKRDT